MGTVMALALALCVVVLAAGLGMAVSEPVGARRVEGRVAVSGRRLLSSARGLRDALASRLAPYGIAVLTTRRRAEIAHRIDAAGRPGGLTLKRHAGNQVVSTITFGVVGVVLALMTGSPAFAPTLAFLGWLLPDLMLLAQVQRRQARIERDLPDFLDVLAVTVSAGIGFRSALARVADALGGPLQEEIKTALQQMAYGIERRAAFEGIRERNDSESLSKFMTALLQAQDLGAPLSDTLGAIAVDLRSAFAQRARREAARADPRVSMIVGLSMVPGFVILVVVAIITASGTDLGRLLG